MNQCEQTILHRPLTEAAVKTAKVPPFRRLEARTGRNQPCHCGSGSKFKRCHGKAA